jgi:hypothetical protein
MHVLALSLSLTPPFFPPHQPQEAAPAAPVQHHSYLSHTAAKRRAGGPASTQPVHAMASFLRPTAASWKRTHKDQGDEGGEVPKPLSSSRGGPVRATATATASAAVLGRRLPTATTAASASRAMGAVGGRGGVESTEERELRLAQEARERLRKVRGFGVGDGMGWDGMCCDAV